MPMTERRAEKESESASRRGPVTSFRSFSLSAACRTTPETARANRFEIPNGLRQGFDDLDAQLEHAD